MPARCRGAALFFKDLTRVEQLEERERLRDRLAALGEMAAAMAHELKNPLAGHRGDGGTAASQGGDSPDAQSIIADIISEAKMANSTVVEMLDYVRPVRLERNGTAIAQVLHTAVSMAESKAQRGHVSVELVLPDDLPLIQGDEHQLCQVFTNLVINAFEALGGKGHIRICRRPRRRWKTKRCPRATRPATSRPSSSRCRTMARASPAT